MRVSGPQFAGDYREAGETPARQGGRRGDAESALSASDFTLDLTPLPLMEEAVAAESLPANLRQYLSDALRAAAKFGRTRLILEEVSVVQPLTHAVAAVRRGAANPAALSDPAAQAAISEMLRSGSAAVVQTDGSRSRQLVLLVRGRGGEGRYRLQAPLRGNESFAGRRGDALSLYWMSLGAQSPMRAFYVHHEATGSGVLLIDPRRWRIPLSRWLEGLLMLTALAMLIAFWCSAH